MSSDIVGFDDFRKELNLANLTERDYLDHVLGPKNLPNTVFWPLTIVYVIIFVIGVVGNVVTCIVIVKNPSLHTATYYYLFNLAVSDLLLLGLGLPHELRTFWQQYPWDLGLAPCKIRSYVSEMSSYVSALTIVAFSMERYLAICHPMRVYNMRKMARPLCFIIAIWLTAIISATPFAIYTKINYVEYPPSSGNQSQDSAICAMLSPNMPKFPLYELSSALFFFLPFVFICYFYISMGREIYKSVRDTSPTGIGRASAHWDSRQVQGRKTIPKMLGAVVGMFFLCWGPFHAQRLLYVHAQKADYYPTLNEWFYIFSGIFYYIGTIVNPIVYNIMSTRYREAFKKTVFCCGWVKSWHTSTKEQTISAKDTNLRRYTIDQPAERFRFGTGRQVQAMDTRTSTDSGRGHEMIDDNFQNKPLLSAKHPIARQQSRQQLSTDSNVPLV